MIYLFAGHNPKGPKPDPGAVANGMREADCAIIQRDLTTSALIQLDNKIRVINDDDSKRLSDVIKGTKSGSGSVICEYHMNAGPLTARGVEVLIPDRHTTAEFECARELAAAISNIMGPSLTPLRGNKGVKTESQSQHPSLAIMRPEGLNVLVEICFITNTAEINRWKVMNTQIAKEHAKILKKYEDMFQ